VWAMKRSVVVWVVLFLHALTAYPQLGGPPAKEDNLYSKALFASISEMDKSWSHIDNSNGGSGIRTDYHHLLVEKDVEVTDGLPTQMGDYHVEYLDHQALIDRYKKLRKEFPVLRIHPIQSDGTRLKIQVSVSYFSYKKQRLLFGFSDWSDVEFGYDCEKQKYIVSSVKLGGI
jgi:hypothetical protein